MPRSPSRDLVDRFTGNRGYFHRADPLRRWKNGVALAALGLTFGWILVEFAMPTRAVSAHSHGELANPHAAFDSNCAACHKPHAAGDPISVFGTHERWHLLTCTKCHAGPEHHKSIKKELKDATACSDCHHDHQGRDHSLVRLSDSHCTKCHQNLTAHVEGRPNYTETITSFAKDHPEFGPLAPPEKAASDRRLKFSHALHMTPGLVYDSNDQHKWTPETLDKQFGANARLRFTPPIGKPTDPVKLICASCHQLDPGQANPDDPDRRRFDLLANTIRGASRQAILPARAEGAYYLPINFDVHCKVCHPLRTPPQTTINRVVVPGLFVQHRRQPAALRPLIRGAYAAQLAIDKHPKLFKPPGPGGRLDPHDDPEVAAFGREVETLTDAALKALALNLCSKCHYSVAPDKNDMAVLPNKAVWFEHAKFNHVSHRGLTCASCHPGTEGAFAPSGAVNEREPALIAGVKTCQACHAEAGTAVELPNGQQAIAAGIRHSCTDCHRYHNGDRPLQGLGAPKRDPAEPLNLSDWLKGKK